MHAITSLRTRALFLLAAAVLPSSARAQERAQADSATHAAVLAEFAPSGVTLAADAPQDTVRKRAKATEVSDSYELRLRIHRYASYSMIPLFALQSVAGNQLFQADKSGAPRPSWASGTHSLGAAGLGVLFSVNTVTGLWNLWESRDNEVGRTKRLIHSALLLASDAGFTYTGLVLASDAKRDASKRVDHRNYAYYSMGAALAGYGVMLVGDH